MSNNQVFGFNSQRVVKKLHDLANASPSRPLVHGLKIPANSFKQDRHYLLEAKDAIPGSDPEQTNPGAGIAYILERSRTDPSRPIQHYEVYGQRVELLVFNLFPTEISAGQRFFCLQDMDGDLWVVGRAGGIICNIVRFHVMASDETTRTVLGEVLAHLVGCGPQDVPDSFIGGTVVEVCDPAGCYFNEPNDELIGRMGYAVHMFPRVENICQPNIAYFVPQWEVFSLCCKFPRCEIIQ